MRRLRAGLPLWMVIGYLLSTALFVSLDYAFLRFMPTGYWFDHTRIEFVSIRRPSRWSAEIVFASTIDRRRAYDQHANEILMCDSHDGGGYRYYSQQIRETDDAEPTHGPVRELWVYAGRVPRDLSTCYLRSVKRAVLRYGIVKSVTIRSAPFQVTPAPP